MNRLALTLVAPLAFASLGMTCGPGIPQTEECASPSLGAGVASIEVGPGQGSFAPWSDGNSADIVIGPQGGHMVPVKLLLHGTAPAGCMQQSTLVRAPGGAEIAADATSVRFSAEGDALLSTTIWLIFNPWSTLDGSWVGIEVEVGDVTAKAQVWLKGPYAGPTVSLPADPIVLGIGQESYLPVTLAAPPPQGMTVFFSTSDATVLQLAFEPYTGFVPQQTQADVYVKGASAGLAELTAWYGQDSVTATVTVE